MQAMENDGAQGPIQGEGEGRGRDEQTRRDSATKAVQMNQDNECIEFGELTLPSATYSLRLNVCHSGYE
eukprot:758976-Hanusia_phi.AAC.5